MKSAWIKFLPLVLGIFLVLSCKNKNGSAGSQNALFQRPELKDITGKINDDPKNAKLYFQRGNILHRLQMDSLSLADYQKAVSLDSSKAEYFSAIGNLLFDHKDVTGSVKWLKKAIALNPQDPVAHLKIAKLFVIIQDYPSAFSEINTVLRQDVYNPEAYFLKGFIYRDLKDTTKAISSFQTAVDVDPKYRDAMLELGQMYSAKKNSLALKYFDNAFKLDTTAVMPLYAKGMFYQNQNDYEKAKQEYKECIMHNTQYASAYFSTGWILLQQDSLDKAWRQFDLVTRIQPNNADAYYNRALCSEMMNKKQDAINDYKQALMFDTAYTEAKGALKRLGAR